MVRGEWGHGIPICSLGDGVKLPFNNSAKSEDYRTLVKLFRIFHVLNKILTLQIYPTLAFHAVILNFIESIFFYSTTKAIFFCVKLKSRS